MNFRVVYISSPCSLKFKNNSLLVNNEQGETFVPLIDISVILIDNLFSSLSAFLLSKLAENKVVLIVTDEKHLPNSILIPFNGKVRMLESYKYQSTISDELRGLFWKKIISNKIKNQSAVLHFGNSLSYLKLDTLINNIQSHDKTNIEAYAASIYWKELFFNSLDYYTRNLDNIRNHALNYGYAIVRSIIANSLTCKGFILYTGIHHCNELNQFNLADDIIEPFRAFVDYEVFTMFELEGIEEIELNKDIKKRLLSIVDCTVLIDNQKFTLLNAVDKYTDSLYNAYKNNDVTKLIEISLWI